MKELLSTDATAAWVLARVVGKCSKKSCCQMEIHTCDNHTNTIEIIIQILAATALVLANGGQTPQEEQLPDGNKIVIIKQIQ